MKYLYVFAIICIITLTGCSKVRESAGVTRKTLDEFKVIENPPLVIPPDFNLIPPEQLDEKNIDDIEKELAKEILFGLDSKEQSTETNNSTMAEILSEVDSSENSKNIRNEINKEFANETKTDDIFTMTWENEIQVLDAVKESQRIRDNNFNSDSSINVDVPIKIIKIKKKKKKRFLLF